MSREKSSSPRRALAVRSAGGAALADRSERRKRAGPRRIGETVKRCLADAAARRGDRAPKGDVVGRVDDQTQVGEQVLDLAPLVESHAAHDDVGNARPAERVLENARLGIGPVEERDITVVQPLAAQRPDRLRHPASFFVLVPGAVDLRPLSLGVVRPEALLPARAVVRDDGRGDAQDALGRAVVLLERHDEAIGEVLLEVEDVAQIGAAPAIHGLVGVAHDAEVPVLLGQKLDDAVLGAVGVLVFVHEHVRPERPVPRERLGRGLEEPDYEQQQVVEVHAADGAQAVFVRAIELGDPLLAGRAREA